MRKINQQRDDDGLSYRRKAMIVTGIASNTIGQWDVWQLTPEPQRTVSNRRFVFDAARSAVLQES